MIRIIVIALISAALASCSPIEATRGHIADPLGVAQIKEGQTTRQDVVKLLGTPSVMGTFDDHTWYYIGQHTEKVAFFDQDVLDRSILALHFNDQGVVDKLQTLNKDDGRQVAMASEITPNGDTDKNFFEELFSHIGKFSPSAGSTGGHGTSGPGQH